MSSVVGSTTRADLKAARLPFSGDSSAVARRNDATTSSAVSGAPSWKRTPDRRWKRHTVGSMISQEVASAGSIFRVSS